MANPHYSELLRFLQHLHDKKSHDYAKKDNPFSNFEFAAEYAGVSVETCFDLLIGIKLARLDELESGKEPLNEPLLDTKLDEVNYRLIKLSYWMKQNGIDKLS